MPTRGHPLPTYFLDAPINYNPSADAGNDTELVVGQQPHGSKHAAAKPLMRLLYHRAVLALFGGAWYTAVAPEYEEAVVSAKPCARLAALLRDENTEVIVAATYALRWIATSATGAEAAVTANVPEYFAEPHKRVDVDWPASLLILIFLNC
ncbi:hypothetical protein B0H17DRAFT_1136464 [Mycena rosella]|uniref:Uncharacterized protein n=1 Tax=Mycena rosella TaxID=1033263 RepID=A0AAD7DDZ5_MYCRO|nr:hypothetical protein B0H17DRAFT_1136464 [Mycena rosella]